MVVVLLLLALSLIGIGGAAVVFGAPIIQVERGYAMVIAGTVASCSGFLLLGIATALQRLGRLVHEVSGLRMRLQAFENTSVPPPVSAAPPASLSPPAAAIPVPPPQYEEPTVVGQYSSGGNAYVMYSDGSIHAETPTGTRQFGSLDELRAFVAAGGERG